MTSNPSSKKNNILVRLVREMFFFPAHTLISFILLISGTLLALARPLLIAEILNRLHSHASLGEIEKGTFFLIVLLCAESLISYFTSYSIASLGQKIIFDLRRRIYHRLLRYSSGILDKTPVGTLITRTVSDIEAMNEVFSQGLLQILGDLLMIILLIVVMLYRNPFLSLSVFAVLPFLILSGSLFRVGVKKSFQRVRDAVAALNVFIQERLNGMYLLRVFNVNLRESERFRKLNAEHRDANIRAIFYYSVFFPVMDLLTSVSLALLMYLAFRMKASGDVGLGDLAFYIMVAQMLFRPIRLLADRINTLQMGMVAARRVYEVLDNHHAVEADGHEQLRERISEIRFEHVNFRYQPSFPLVLKDISFSLERGKKLAVIGSTGSGKSTLAQLLAGMYSNYEGSIRINEIELRNLNKEQIRKKICIVLQDVFLFNDTLLENIRFFDSNISEETVREASKELGLLEFIESFPDGLQYRIRERGNGLSAGQKQLVAFLRAHLLAPEIFIFDEATSYLDAKTEHFIQKAMLKILGQRTAIIIAHRLSTVMACDDVMVIEKGNIKELGPLKFLYEHDSSAFRAYLNAAGIS